MKFKCISFFFILLPSLIFSEVKVGDVVKAQWEKDKMYYIGTAVEEDTTIKGGGFKIIYADGDQAVVPITLIKEVKIEPGLKVLALWSDKKYYPGTINKVIGNALYIFFDDGDKGWTSLAGLLFRE